MASPYSVRKLDRTTTLQGSDYGNLFICSQDSAYDITLPKVSDAKGWYGTFLLGTAGSNDFDIIGGTTDSMIGLECGDTNVVVSDADKVTFVSGNCSVGERVDVFCDGENYYVTMFGVADNAMSSSG